MCIAKHLPEGREMQKQTILWTAIPNGLGEDGRLRISVLVSFRLASDATSLTLGQFPDLLSNQLDWPAIVRNARFSVRFGQVILPAERVVDIASDPPDPDSALWQALFEPTTFVRPYKYDDYRDRLILSFPYMQVHKEIRRVYVELMEKHAAQLPRPSDLVQLFMDDILNIASPEALLAALKDMYPGGAIPWSDLPALPTPYPHLALLRLFHTPPSKSYIYKDSGSGLPEKEQATWKTHKRVKLPDDDDFKDLLDFHQRIAALQQYPRLLRRLGLVFDLAVDPPGSNVSLASPFKLSVVPRLRLHPPGQSGVKTENAALYTWANLNGETFQAHPKNKNQDSSQGLLRLDSQKYHLVQVDVDGSAIKLLNTITSAYQQGKSNKEDEEEMGAATLRTGGLAVIHEEKGKWLEDKIQANSELNNDLEGNQPKDVELYAEDLVRGVFLDVWDDATHQWRSLCQRSGSYHFQRTGQTINLADEGVLQTGVTQSADYPDNPQADQIYQHEISFDWRGWSLVAPRKGKTIDSDDQPDTLPLAPPPGLNLEVNFEPLKSSLPKLRFGRRYKLRARVVDLSGNSLPVTTADIGDGTITTQTAPYLRFESVPAPALALVDDGGLKEPSEGESMDRVAVRSLNSSPDEDVDPTSQAAQRFVLPPRITQISAETHGMFDLPTGQLNQQAYATITNQDQSLSETIVNGNRYAFGQYPLKTPYLSDPFAHEVMIQVLDHKKQPIPGVNLPPVPVFDQAHTWPEALPFRIDLQEGNLNMTFNPASRLLEVRLPKAELVYLRLSFQLTRLELEQMGLWQWRLQEGSPTNQEIDDAMNGRNWLLTPWRDVALVHATQQPLGLPELIELAAQRLQNRTYVQPFFYTPLNRKSTAKVHLLAHWNEPDDNLTKKWPENVVRDDHAFEYKVPLEEPYDLLDLRDLAPHHELGSTRYHRITYTLEATTRFREYMDPDLNLSAEDLKRVSEPVTIYVSNTARPQAARVLYVLPLFEWDRQMLDGGGVSSLRKGGGLRVYLERPWYSSGYGEMLAVVLLGASSEAIELDDMKPFITQWGRDPMWLSPSVPGIAPDRTQFKQARFSDDAIDPVLMKDLQPEMPSEEHRVLDAPFPVKYLQLPEAPPGVTFEIAPHDVGYDHDRQLWYCDILVDPGPAYTPFIRLALARYHPNSVEGTHLSPVVLADFAQLSPDRYVSVSPVQDNPNARRVTVSGYGHSGSSLQAELDFVHFPAPIENLIHISLEKLLAGADPDLEWQAISTSITVEEKVQPFIPILWQGTVNLPASPAEDEKYRIVIREYERIAADIGFGKRLVYVEAVEVS
jgi:hypothetical protein